MKKRIVVVIFAVALMAMLVFFCSTLRISLNFDSDGNLKSIGTFTVDFHGSDKYTDEELATFLFETDMQANPFVFLWNDKFGEHVEIPFIEEYDVEIKSLTSYEVTFYDKSIVGYVEYMGSYKYFDKDGIVVESSRELLANVPHVTGVDFDFIVMHSKLPVSDDRLFDILLDITQLISKHDIVVEKINISSELEIKLYMENGRVDLGKNENLSEKVMDLSDIIRKYGEVKGILDMKEYDPQGNGYSSTTEE